MYGVAHEWCDRCIDHAVALELRAPAECRAGDADPEMTALQRPGMSGVLRTVVDDLEREGLQLALEREADLRKSGS